MDPNGCVNLSCKTCDILVSKCILRWLLNLFFPWKVLRDAQFLVKDFDLHQSLIRWPGWISSQTKLITHWYY